jgi:predicted PurR-regulated permease PerM
MNTGFSSTTRYLIFIILLMGFLIFLYVIRALIGPLLIACLLAYILNPAVTFLKNRGDLNHKRSVLVVFSLFLLSLVAVSISIVPVIIKQARSLSAELQVVLPQIEDKLRQPMDLFGYDLQFDSFIEELRSTKKNFFIPERVFRVIKGATTNLVWLLIIFVTTYCLLLDWEQLREWLFHLAPEAYQADLHRLHEEIKSVWGAYLRGQLLLMTIVGLISGITAFVIGLPRAALVGLLAGILDFIPSIGPAIATGAAGFIAWIEGSNVLTISNLWFVFIVIFLFTLIQLVESIWLQPSIMRHRVRLHRGIIFVAILGTLMLGSALLALIIVPTIGSIRLIGGYLRQHIFIQEPDSNKFVDETELSMEVPSDMQDENLVKGEVNP